MPINSQTLEIRELMDEHKIYDKEKMLNDPKEQKKERFIWSYIIKPVRKDYEDKWTKLTFNKYLINQCPCTHSRSFLSEVKIIH